MLLIRIKEMVVSLLCLGDGCCSYPVCCWHNLNPAEVSTRVLIMEDGRPPGTKITEVW